MKNKTYDLLKKISLVILPAIATLYGAIGHAWGIPYTNAVVVTITAIDTFIGTVLGISTSNYNKNTVSSVDIEEDSI